MGIICPPPVGIGLTGLLNIEPPGPSGSGIAVMYNISEKKTTKLIDDDWAEREHYYHFILGWKLK